VAYLAKRAIALASRTAEPLPDVEWLGGLHDNGYHFYRGMVSMVAGVPGAMKSMFALAYANATGLDCLYFSADSDSASQLSRLSAMRSGVDSDYTRVHLNTPQGEETLAESKVQFCFDANPDLPDMQDEVDAWVEKYNSFPDIIVVDNLRNIWNGDGSGSEHASYKATQQLLITLARNTGACVITLHHMVLPSVTDKDADDKMRYPRPQYAIDGKVSQLPDFILSVAKDGDDFRFAVVKDRYRPFDPSGKTYHELVVDGSTGTFRRGYNVQERAQTVASAMLKGVGHPAPPSVSPTDPSYYTQETLS
jgi:hypothetical protein